jgi:hypothetical protein
VIVHGGEAGTKGYPATNQYQTPFAWIPALRSDANFDAVMCTDTHIVTVQVTVAAKHSMNEKGFESLLTNLPPNFQKQRSWHHVFVTDHPDTAVKLRKKKYQVAENMKIQVHTAVLNIQLFNYSPEVLNCARMPSVSRHGLLYIYSGTNWNQGKPVGIEMDSMEVDAGGEQQVGNLFLSTGAR